MNRDPYAIPLKNAITEIQKAYPDITHSFIFTKTRTIINGEKETDEKTMNDVLESFEDLKEKAKAIGDLKDFKINTKNGSITLSKINDMYLVLATSKNADKSQIYAITHVILPTILKTVDTLDSSHLQPLTPPQKELVVDNITGFFAGDSVQIDTEVLMDWIRDNDPRARIKAAIMGEPEKEEDVSQVYIETLDGNTAVCKVKEVDDENMKGKNMIRIPEKLCKSLEINKGDLVKVKPAE